MVKFKTRKKTNKTAKCHEWNIQHFHTEGQVAIPGWHTNGHGVSCRDNFNLSSMEGIGRMVVRMWR